MKKTTATTKSTKRKFFASLLCAATIISAGSISLAVPETASVLSLTVSATQDRSSSFSKNYELTGNNASDLVAVAMAQLGKTGKQLGYSEQWCADFTTDCARLAGISAIPYNYASRGRCIDLYKYMVNNCGASVVSSPQKGDIVFFDWNGKKSESNLHHVAIVTGYSNNTVYLIGGNQGSENTLSDRKVTQNSYSINSKYIAKIVRPKYTNTSINTESASIFYQGHCQDIGWQSSVSNGSTAGTTGKSLRLECLKVKITGVSGGVRISTHQANIGWVPFTSASSGNWVSSGTTGQSRAIEAVKLELYGEAANKYNITYRIHSQNIGWGNFVTNGAVAGTTGRSLRAEAIEIKLTPKSKTSTTPVNTSTTYFPRYTGNSGSIVTGLKAAGADSSYAYRQKIAATNGISNYTGTAAQNTTMLNKLKSGTLKKPSTGSNSTPSSPTTSYFPRYTGSSGSIVTGLKAVGADSSYAYRQKIAATNGISNYTGTAAQNTTMLNKLKSGTLKKP